MAHQPIDHGSAAGDGQGEALFSAFTKVNANDAELFGAKTVFVANYAALPVVGEVGKVYVTIDDDAMYRWTGTAYDDLGGIQFVANAAALPATGEALKVYIALDTGRTYRWDSTEYVVLALGERIINRFSVSQSRDIAAAKFDSWLSKRRKFMVNPVPQHLTPTHFFDAGATGSSGVGTYANPFTTFTQMETWLNSLGAGGAAGKIVGFKRGSVLTHSGYLMGAGAVSPWGTAGNPFIMCAYGDAEALPLLSCFQPLTAWTAVGGTPLWQATTTGSEGDLYQGKVRAFQKADQAAVLAAGPGFYWRSGNTVQLYPYAGEDPRVAGAMEQMTGQNGQNNMNIRLTRGTVGEVGHIHIHDLHLIGAGGQGIIVNLASSANIASIDDIVISGCMAGQIGDTTPTNSGGNTGFSYYGGGDLTNLVRATNVYMGANFVYDLSNNCVEAAGTDGAIMEWNEGNGIAGRVVEMFGSDLNPKVRYNFLIGTKGDSRWSSSQFAGIWTPNWGMSASGAMVTNNANIALLGGGEYVFNVLVNIAGHGIKIDAPNGDKVYNNTVIGTGADGYFSYKFGGTAYITTGMSVSYLGNIGVNAGVGANNQALYSSTGVTLTRSDANYLESGSANLVSAHPTGGTTALYATLAAWKANAVSARDVQSQSGGVTFGQYGEPGAGLSKRGYLPAGYTVDAVGAPLVGPIVGSIR